MNSTPADEEAVFAARKRIIEQAIILIEQVYVHLPLKRAMHAVEPIQRLKLLLQNYKELKELDFHYEIVSIFSCLRDRHTTYILPEPYPSYVAFLPFRIQQFFEEKVPRYIVTAVMPTVSSKHFKRGVIVTHWNGVPIHRAIEINADREEGSNLEARIARGLEAMTIRPLGLSKPPDEKWVVVSYEAQGRERESRFPWTVYQRKSAGKINPLAPSLAHAQALGMDSKSDIEREVRKDLFSPETILEEWKSNDPESVEVQGMTNEEFLREFGESRSNFSFHPLKPPYENFGYVRIFSFNEPSDKDFVRKFIRVLKDLPQAGLIIDVRGNAGGNISAGERLLQLLTPRQIEPSRFHFINSPATLKLCERKENGFINQWEDSIKEAVKTAAPYSYGFPLLDADQYNDIGQVYYGPVVLLTDALSYSTTDIFVAGFKDHEIGRIIGTSRNTGAGGANVWYYNNLSELLPGEFPPLSGNASFSIAVRRATRVGKHTGVLIEDLGVSPDEHYLLTKDDVLNRNVDLIAHAASILSSMQTQSQWLSVAVEYVNGVPDELVATTKNITRLDLMINDRPRASEDVVTESPTRFKLKNVSLGSSKITVKGFRDNRLVASSLLNL